MHRRAVIWYGFLGSSCYSHGKGWKMTIEISKFQCCFENGVIVTTHLCCSSVWNFYCCHFWKSCTLAGTVLRGLVGANKNNNNNNNDKCILAKKTHFAMNIGICKFKLQGVMNFLKNAKMPGGDISSILLNVCWKIFGASIYPKFHLNWHPRPWRLRVSIVIIVIVGGGVRSLRSFSRHAMVA